MGRIEQCVEHKRRQHSLAPPARRGTPSRSIDGSFAALKSSVLALPMLGPASPTSESGITSSTLCAASTILTTTSSMSVAASATPIRNVQPVPRMPVVQDRDGALALTEQGFVGHGPQDSWLLSYQAGMVFLPSAVAASSSHSLGIQPPFSPPADQDGSEFLTGPQGKVGTCFVTWTG